MPLQLSGTDGVLDNSGAFVRGTAVASTSGTSIDFTSIPSWVKRITVNFYGVSTNGSSAPLLQLGAGSVTSTGYVQTAFNTTGGYSSSTAGFQIYLISASQLLGGQIVFTTLGSNNWTATGTIGNGLGTQMSLTGGYVPLSGALDRVRITTTNGTDAFDAGSINILYE